MDHGIKENLKMARKKEMESFMMMSEKFIKVPSKMIKDMVHSWKNMYMAIFIKEFINTIKKMDMGLYKTQMAK